MQDALRFIKGAISRKDFVPALKHVSIHNGFIKSFNGNVALGSPIDFPADVCPVADKFIKAIDRCEEAPEIKMTAAGRLRVSSGKFKVFVNALPNEVFPDLKPEGDYYPIECDLVEALESLQPFIGTDAAKPWALGVIVRQNYAYATNNVVLACHTKPLDFPCDLIVPAAAITELLRIKEPVIGVQISANSLSFHFAGEKWLRTNLVDAKAPEFYNIFSKCNFELEHLNEMPEDLGDRLDKLKPFLDAKTPTITFRSTGMFTNAHDDEEGASDTTYKFDLAVFRFEPLEKVVSLATHWNLSYYPSQCPFVGPNISGVIIGQKVPK